MAYQVKRLLKKCWLIKAKQSFLHGEDFSCFISVEHLD